jgi:hypothetical protein
LLEEREMWSIRAAFPAIGIAATRDAGSRLRLTDNNNIHAPVTGKL